MNGDNGSVIHKNILHSGFSSKVKRDWQSCGYEIHPWNIMCPLFIVDDPDSKQPIEALPNVFRLGINRLEEFLQPIVKNKLSSILLFGVPTKIVKDEFGSSASNVNENPVILAITKIKEMFPELNVACDVCLCAFTSHGHCGIMDSNGLIDNAKSIKRLAEVALAYAKAGADIVAPSDMVDGRVLAIKNALHDANLNNRVSVLSYSVKFASSFYGPFRDAAKSTPSSGDRKCYQLPPMATGLAMRAAARDVEEGADMLMVKPGLSYLDIAKRVKEQHPTHPLFIYQVSGEYAMLYHGAKANALNLKDALFEILGSMRRAGADVIITYFAPQVLQWLKQDNAY